MQELALEDETSGCNLTEEKVRLTMQEAMLQDRDLVDKSQDAFVSFLRYYKEHQLTFIFSQTLLDLGQAANSFHLFKIPRVKEILGKPIKSFVGRSDVDLDKIAYKDSNKGR